MMTSQFNKAPKAQTLPLPSMNPTDSNMSRDISPPPSKRRKISAQANSTPALSSSQSPPSSMAPPTLKPNTLRLFSWNINGISPFLQESITSFFGTSQIPASKPATSAPIPPASLRGFLHRHNWPGILFLQEVKISQSDEKTQDAVRKAINTKVPDQGTGTENGPVYETHFTLPNDPLNARGPRGSGKVYGVCSIIRRDLISNWQANVRTVDWDKEGRISIVELTTPTSKLALFNIYAVNGTDNPYRDLSTGAIRGTRHDRKREFHRLLMDECVELEKRGWHVILAGDMNVAPDALDGHPKLRQFPQQHVVNRADFNARFLGKGKERGGGVFDGVDVWREMHGGERRYTYYSRGREWGSSCDRVDYAIVERKTWDEGLVTGAGILDSDGERGPSDHVPIWVDVALKKE